MMAATSQKPSVGIVILNYRGAELLPKCLPSIVAAAKKASYPTRVIILDNPGPLDSGLDYVKANFPEVVIERAPKNRVLCSYNDYLPKMTESIAVLLNNDIRVDENFIDPLVRKFLDDDKTFLAASRVMSFDGSQIDSARSVGKLQWGIFWCSARYPGYEKEEMIPSDTYSSGFGAFSREKFLALGGYDDRYLPGIMEDVDICYRARKVGYSLYYEPQSLVYHMGQASFKKKYGSRQTAVIAHRNNFLFMWKNFSGFSFWAQHLFFLPFRLLFSFLTAKTELCEGFVEALRHPKRTAS